MKKAFIFIFLSLFLAACDDNKSIEPTPTPTPTSESTTTDSGDNEKVIKGDFSEKKALEFLFDNYDETQKESNWTPTKGDLAKADEDSPLREAKEFYIKTVLISPFQQAGVDKQLLITAATPPEHTCHACAPIIGAFVFKKSGNDWELETEQKYVVELGSYGTAPDAKLTKIGKDTYGALFESGDSGQGLTSEAVVVIAKIDKEFKEILTVETGGDNFGACGDDLGPCWKFSSKYEFVPGKDENFFDFKISTSGTRSSEEGDSTVPVDEETVFNFDGREYKAKS